MALTLNAIFTEINSYLTYRNIYKLFLKQHYFNYVTLKYQLKNSFYVKLYISGYLTKIFSQNKFN